MLLAGSRIHSHVFSRGKTKRKYLQGTSPVVKPLFLVGHFFSPIHMESQFTLREPYTRRAPSMVRDLSFRHGRWHMASVPDIPMFVGKMSSPNDWGQP